jgi:hypothetical protein
MTRYMELYKQWADECKRMYSDMQYYSFDEFIIEYTILQIYGRWCCPTFILESICHFCDMKGVKRKCHVSSKNQHASNMDVVFVNGRV